jgi:hypothetical protein
VAFITAVLELTGYRLSAERALCLTLSYLVAA